MKILLFSSLFYLINGFFYSYSNKNIINLQNPSKRYDLNNNYYQNNIRKNLKENKEQIKDNKHKKNYDFTRNYYENYIRKLNSRNISLDDDDDDENDNFIENFLNNLYNTTDNGTNGMPIPIPLYDDMGMYTPKRNDIRIIFTQDNNNQNDNYETYSRNKKKKSENFEVTKNTNFNFTNIGGYENIKNELLQCVDILVNYKKYEHFSVRVPKGLILEGPPGNGKTLLAKGFAGESNASFIAISGSQFQEKYVGVGSARVRELFKLAKENLPCIIFIDEIDAIGRKRSSDSETASSERDSTLNELLVNLDGFNTIPGIFLIGATNRVDLLDQALLRPGRIDKKIYIGQPDENTRKAIINIHIKNKPYDDLISIDYLVDISAGMSGAQIENFLNEAMLLSIRNNMNKITLDSIETCVARELVGWQSNEHIFTQDIIDRIAIHEMGHAIVGMNSVHHAKVSKIALNFNSPKSPGYTVFEQSKSNIYTREALFEHLAILLAGRVAEEVFYGLSVTTGALSDFDEALKLAEKMVIYYGMGKRLVYSDKSEKYREEIDNDIAFFISTAYSYSKNIIEKNKNLIIDCAILLKTNKILKPDVIYEIINTKYPELIL
jgi:cell division protease FtsH